MGKIDNLVDFTKEHIKNRDLIISMLKYEDSIILGKVADKIFKSGVFELFNNLETTFIWTGSLLAYINFWKLRITRDTQFETMQIAQEMLHELKLRTNMFEHSLKAFYL